MGADTKIEWAHHSFNAWSGCAKVSPACDHCYAEAQAKRAPKTFGGWGPHAARKRTSEANWRKPLAWNRQAQREGRRFRVFCASMADVFDNQVPAEWREDLWALIHDTPHLDWLLLTKRPQNIAKMLPAAGGLIEPRWPWPNVWLGTTVENQAEADRRIPHLLAVPAARRFLSCEPLLGPVDLRGWLPGDDGCEECDDGAGMAPPRCSRRDIPRDQQCPRNREVVTTHEGPRGADGCPEWVGVERITLDWIIAGGESGPKARPSHPDWFRSLRDQCVSAGVPFFFKQWGEWRPICQGEGDWYDSLYRSRVAAREGEDQAAKDEAYGRLCTVEQLCLRVDGQHAGVAAPMAWLQGTRPVLGFRVGKKLAGATLDGREWREVPA